MTTHHPCPNCPALRAEVARLEAEVAMLLRIISAAQRECMVLANEAGQPMPKGVAPVFWASEKARREAKGEAAGRVLEKLTG